MRLCGVSHRTAAATGSSAGRSPLEGNQAALEHLRLQVRDVEPLAAAGDGAVKQLLVVKGRQENACEAAVDVPLHLARHDALQTIRVEPVRAAPGHPDRVPLQVVHRVRKRKETLAAPQALVHRVARALEQRQKILRALEAELTVAEIVEGRLAFDGVPQVERREGCSRMLLRGEERAASEGAAEVPSKVETGGKGHNAKAPRTGATSSSPCLMRAMNERDVGRWHLRGQMRAGSFRSHRNRQGA